GSAAIQCRFYDLATGMATLISSAGKKHSLGECGRRLLRFQEKAWLTFFGYQSLSEFAALPPTPLTPRIDAIPGRRAPKWGRKQQDSRRCSGLCRRSCFRCSLQYPAYQVRWRLMLVTLAKSLPARVRRLSMDATIGWRGTQAEPALSWIS